MQLLATSKEKNILNEMSWDTRTVVRYFKFNCCFIFFMLNVSRAALFLSVLSCYMGQSMNYEAYKMFTVNNRVVPIGSCLATIKLKVYSSKVVWYRVAFSLKTFSANRV